MPISPPRLGAASGRLRRRQAAGLVHGPAASNGAEQPRPTTSGSVQDVAARGRTGRRRRRSSTTAPAMPAERRASSCDHLPPYGVGVAPTAANGLPREGARAVGPREPVDGVVEDGGHRAVVLRGHREHAVRAGDLVAQPLGRGGHGAVGAAVELLVVERDLARGPRRSRRRAGGGLVAQRLGDAAVEGVGAQAADAGRRRGCRTWGLLEGMVTLCIKTDRGPVVFPVEARARSH